MSKKRIDVLLMEKDIVKSLDEAVAVLMAGEVRIGHQLITTPGVLVDVNTEIVLSERMPYVSRGGYKLAFALKTFNASPVAKICADVGASTGGFTDVLLQHGANKVYAIDVGYGDLAWKLRQDPKVVVLERTNARKLSALPESISFVVIDTSFISLTLILPATLKWVEPNVDFIVLVKPQFEAPKLMVEPGGVIKNPDVHRQVLWDLMTWATANGFVCLDLMPSPIIGPAGNKEFLLHLALHQPSSPPNLHTLLELCLSS